MKPGNLVTVEKCGGSAGSLLCNSALVLSVELSHSERVQIDSQAYAYTDRDVYECTLICSCGIFEEYDDRLEVLQSDH